MSFTPPVSRDRVIWEFPKVHPFPFFPVDCCAPALGRWRKIPVFYIEITVVKQQVLVGKVVVHRQEKFCTYLNGGSLTFPYSTPEVQFVFRLKYSKLDNNKQKDCYDMWYIYAPLRLNCYDFCDHFTFHPYQVKPLILPLKNKIRQMVNMLHYVLHVSIYLKTQLCLLCMWLTELPA